MARVLGTVQDMEEYNQQYKTQQQIKSRLAKKVKAIYKSEDIPFLEVEPEVIDEITPLLEEKTKRERKQTPREQQMNRPIFNSDYEKFEWLMSNGTTNSEDRKWLVNYMKSDEYINLYGDEE